jgi:hypothetical protein
VTSNIGIGQGTITALIWETGKLHVITCCFLDQAHIFSIVSFARIHLMIFNTRLLLASLAMAKLASGLVDTVSLSCTLLVSYLNCTSLTQILLLLQEAIADGSVSFLVVEIKTDKFSSETGWYVSVGNEVVYTVLPGTYENGREKHLTSLSLTDGDYQLTLTDSRQNGIKNGKVTVYYGDAASADKVVASADKGDIFFNTRKKHPVVGGAMYTLNFSVRRYRMMSLIQSRNPSTTFTDSSSPPNKALDWILSDPFSSDELSDDRLVQRFALATLYYSTDGANWINVGGWLTSTNECDWGGSGGLQILCSQEYMVERVYVENNQMMGSIPSELGLLKQLTWLGLSHNELTGSIPSELGLLNQLTTLHLSYNQLTESLPSELGLLKQLNGLGLIYNQLTGSLPSELGLLKQLNGLHLYNNDLTGSIPSELGLLIQLTYLSLVNNQLTGSIPSEFGLLTQLTYLRLAYNDLTGSIPSSLCSADRFIWIDCGEIACTCCLSGVDGTSCPSP